ncbi:MAG: hypothetical protein CMP20_04610 [Rickettsiales bacterium]|nr:hypothetical protein [Rickettsiales bacterium]
MSYETDSYSEFSSEECVSDSSVEQFKLSDAWGITVIAMVPTTLLVLMHGLMYSHIKLAECNNLSDWANDLNALVLITGLFRVAIKLVQEWNDNRRRAKFNSMTPPLNWWVEALDIATKLLSLGTIVLFVMMWIEQGSDSKPFAVTQSVFAIVAFLELAWFTMMQCAYIVNNK